LQTGPREKEKQFWCEAGAPRERIWTGRALSDVGWGSDAMPQKIIEIVRANLYILVFN